MADISHEDRWREAVTSWTRWQPRWSSMAAPLDDAIVAAVEARPGMHVLDLACGGGDPTIALARAAGEAGYVVGGDPVAGMLDLARRRIDQAGLTNVELSNLRLGPLPFPARSFDAVTCRFGLVYAADSILAVREMARILVPGGRMAIMVWGDRRRNEYWSVELDALARLSLLLPQPLDDPVEFAFEKPGTLSAVLHAAGVRDVREEELSLTLRWPGPPEELWEEVDEDTAGLGLPAAARARFRDEVSRGYAALADGEGVLLRSTVVLGTGSA